MKKINNKIYLKELREAASEMAEKEHPISYLYTSSNAIFELRKEIDSYQINLKTIKTR